MANLFPIYISKNERAVVSPTSVTPTLLYKVTIKEESALVYLNPLPFTPILFHLLHLSLPLVFLLSAPYPQNLLLHITAFPTFYLLFTNTPFYSPLTLVNLPSSILLPFHYPFTTLIYALENRSAKSNIVVDL